MVRNRGRSPVRSTRSSTRPDGIGASWKRPSESVTTLLLPPARTWAPATGTRTTASSTRPRTVFCAETGDALRNAITTTIVVRISAREFRVAEGNETRRAASVVVVDQLNFEDARTALDQVHVVRGPDLIVGTRDVVAVPLPTLENTTEAIRSIHRGRRRT